MKLSKNLSLGEVIKSNTASRKGINNSPTPEHLDNLKLIAEEIFQPIREHFGKPIFVSSGYRSEKLNEAIGGSKTSAHSVGCALDLDMDYREGPTNAEVFYYIKENLDYDQLIWEFGDESNPDWVHVGIAKSGDLEDNRNQILIAYKVGGKTKYKFWDKD